MKLLVLGGTHFVGRQIVLAALDRGHEVTLFNRGRSDPAAFPELERLVGDREGDYGTLVGRSWDAVVDPSGFSPGVVERTCAVLAGSVAHYTFISSTAVYDLAPPADRLTEESPVRRHTGGTDVYGDDYGALKAACEATLAAAFRRRPLVVRPGLLAGPEDLTDRLTYWPRRIAEGGDVLAPAPPTRSFRVLDVRDLAGWIVQMIEDDRVGTYNATGNVTTLGRLLQTCKDVTGGDARIVWVDEDFLLEWGVAPWTELPLWMTGPQRKLLRIADNGRARSRGLALRPLANTVSDTFEWDKTRPRPLPRGRVGARYVVETITAAREAELLSLWSRRTGATASE